LTRKKFEDSGIACPDVYGDPALLCPRYYNFPVEKSHDIGIIPHFMDLRTSVITELQNRGSVFVIDITASVKKVIYDIRSCDRVISSSLHGLIIADSFDIPSLWLSHWNKDIKDSFKFQDYYASIGVRSAEPVNLESPREIDKAARRCISHEVALDLDKLWEACPIRAG
jgi:pyruvyltransferase